VSAAAPNAQAAVEVASPLSPEALWARWNELRGDPYALDSVRRRFDEPRRRLRCNTAGFVVHKGGAVRYYGAVTVSRPFRERLERFERVVADTAVEVYGRAPSRIRHYGAYSCRSSRNRSHRLSEHALGNAIDIVGFDFAPLKKREVLPEGVPRALRGSFQVRVASHWEKAGSETTVLHATFLRLVTERLAQRTDIFRGMIGPSRRGHADHFHFDVAPWRYVWL
jgi:hypothetical protein